jgi:ATP-dependent protease HslVU (ClpYQ) peptidase subunit
MSIVACCIYDDKIEIASDSITVYGYTQDKGKTRKWTKLWQGNDITVGIVGYCDEGSLFQIYCTTRKPRAATVDDITQFITEFANWKKEKTDKFEITCDYIFIYQNKAFFINGFYIDEIRTYHAIGAGMDYALSVLYLGHSVEKAVETACELSIYCEQPINKLVIKK